MFDNVLVPKVLMFDAQYRYLSDSAKVLYSLILTQFLDELDSNTQYYPCDDEERVYVNISRQKMYDFLNLDLLLFNKKMNELVHNDLLIIDEQAGDLLKVRIVLLGK